MLQRLQEPLVDQKQSADSLLERKHARLKSFEEEDANQAAERCASAVQAGVWLTLLLVGRDVVVQAIPGVG